MKLSLLKKIRLYSKYRRLLNNKEESFIKANIPFRKDLVNRLYTVVNLPEQDDVYGQSLADKYLRKRISEMDSFLMEIGLHELTSLKKVEKLNDVDYLIIYGYRHFDSAKFTRRFLTLGGITLLLSIILLIIILIF